MISTKDKLIQKIQASKDDDLINDLLTIFEGNDAIVELSNLQVNSIKKGQSQIKAGELFTSEEIDRQFKKWQGK